MSLVAKRHRRPRRGGYRALALALLLLMPWSAKALTIVHFELAQPTLDLGESTTLEVLADFDTPVLGFGLDLILDPAVLGSSLLEIGPSFTPVFAPDGDGLAGLASLTGVVGNDVLLARLTLTRTGLAGTQITGAVTPGDLTEGFPLVGSGFDAFTFEPTLLPAVPEPGTGLLVAAGLLTLCARGRRP